MGSSGASKSASFILLTLNVGLYLIVTVIASWAVNHAINTTHEEVSTLSIPLRIFPMYFPLGNMATGFFVIFSLLAGVVGMTTSITGVQNILNWDSPNLNAAAGSSVTTLSLTLLALGLACKEIERGRWTDSNIRALEVVMIIVSGTQLLCTGAIHMGVEDCIQWDRRQSAATV